MERWQTDLISGRCLFSYETGIAQRLSNMKDPWTGKAHILQTSEWQQEIHSFHTDLDFRLINQPN